MAVPTWARTVGGSAATAAVVGAAELGVVSGLGIVRWDGDVTSDAWHWQLTWLALLAAVAVAAGALVGRWREVQSGSSDTHTLHAVVAMAAAAGAAAAMVPLVLHPAHAVHVPEPGNPALTRAIATGAGLVLGVVAGLSMLAVPAIAGNVITTVTWLWLAGLGSAAWTIGHGDAWGVARPGLLPASGSWIPLALLGPPALIALMVAAVARFVGGRAIWVALSGLAGPALLALAYVIGAPGGGAQTTSYRYALLAVPLSTALSVLVAVARQTRRRAHPHRSPEPDRPPAEPSAELRIGAHRSLVNAGQASAAALGAADDAGAGAAGAAGGVGAGEAEEPDPPVRAEPADRPVPAADAEYVDWVKGLGGASATSVRGTP
jgi:hypothetical protein